MVNIIKNGGRQPRSNKGKIRGPYGQHNKGLDTIFSSLMNRSNPIVRSKKCNSINRLPLNRPNPIRFPIVRTKCNSVNRVPMNRPNPIRSKKCPYLNQKSNIPKYSELTPQKFMDKMNHPSKNNKILAVAFYAPWCGHCKDLMPKWSKAASQLKKHNIELGAIDSTKDSPLMSRLNNKYNINAFPSIKVFKPKSGDKGIDYNGGRDVGDIIHTLKQMNSPHKQMNSPHKPKKFKCRGNKCRVI